MPNACRRRHVRREQGSKSMTQVAWQGADRMPGGQRGGQPEWSGTARTDASGAMSGGSAIAPAGPMSPDALADIGLQTGSLHSQQTHEQARTGGEVILDLQNISLSFGGVKALTDISFNVCEHEIRAIIGPNGAGK